MDRKYYELDKEEQVLARAYEGGKLKPLKGQARTKIMNELRQAARATLERNKIVNLRLSERDLILIKRKAAEEGLPYQTLISSVIHKFATKKEG
jgi:predicted DNA binding CopG/RHH family protein